MFLKKVLQLLIGLSSSCLGSLGALLCFSAHLIPVKTCNVGPEDGQLEDLTTDLAHPDTGDGVFLVIGDLVCKEKSARDLDAPHTSRKGKCEDAVLSHCLEQVDTTESKAGSEVVNDQCVHGTINNVNNSRVTGEEFGNLNTEKEGEKTNEKANNDNKHNRDLGDELSSVHVALTKVGTHTNLKSKTTAPVERPKDTPETGENGITSNEGLTGVLSADATSGEGNELKTRVLEHNTNSHGDDHLGEACNTGLLKKVPGPATPVRLVVTLNDHGVEGEAANLEEHGDEGSKGRSLEAPAERSVKGHEQVVHEVVDTNSESRDNHCGGDNLHGLEVLTDDHVHDHRPKHKNRNVVEFLGELRNAIRVDHEGNDRLGEEVSDKNRDTDDGGDKDSELEPDTSELGVASTDGLATERVERITGCEGDVAKELVPCVTETGGSELLRTKVAKEGSIRVDNNQTTERGEGDGEGEHTELFHL
mmetsp:Transcript_11472/g.22540  ORF Transcript_11472/g.22540 Transcript_11472/m.22540 type:complete len:476 (-) Transcript_11472:477-1904(-)